MGGNLSRLRRKRQYNATGRANIPNSRVVTGAVPLRVGVVVLAGRVLPVVVGPQVVSDLVYVRQVVEAVRVDDGVPEALESRFRGRHDVPGDNDNNDNTAGEALGEHIIVVSMRSRERA